MHGMLLIFRNEIQFCLMFFCERQMRVMLFKFRRHSNLAPVLLRTANACHVIHIS